MCIRDGHGLMTTVEFPCATPCERSLSPHDTYRGWNSDAHAIAVLPRQRHVGYVHHVMLTQEPSPSASSTVSQGESKIAQENIAERETRMHALSPVFGKFTFRTTRSRVVPKPLLESLARDSPYIVIYLGKRSAVI